MRVNRLYPLLYLVVYWWILHFSGTVGYLNGPTASGPVPHLFALATFPANTMLRYRDFVLTFAPEVTCVILFCLGWLAVPPRSVLAVLALAIITCVLIGSSSMDPLLLPYYWAFILLSSLPLLIAGKRRHPSFLCIFLVMQLPIVGKVLLLPAALYVLALVYLAKRGYPPTAGKALDYSTLLALIIIAGLYSWGMTAFMI